MIKIELSGDYVKERDAFMLEWNEKIWLTSAAAKLDSLEMVLLLTLGVKLDEGVTADGAGVRHAFGVDTVDCLGAGRFRFASF